MNLGRLNHIGIATSSIEKSIAHYQTIMRADYIHTPFNFPDQDVRICFIDTPDTQIELIEPLTARSSVCRFLERHPMGGQHHLCFEVPDLQAARHEFTAMGKRILGEPRLGAHGVLVFFIHPKDMDGVLVEIMEQPNRGGGRDT